MARRELTPKEREALAHYGLPEDTDLVSSGKTTIQGKDYNLEDLARENARLREQLRATRRDFAMSITEPCKRGYRYSDGSNEHVAEAKHVAELRWPEESAEEIFKDIDEDHCCECGMVADLDKNGLCHECRDWNVY